MNISCKRYKEGQAVATQTDSYSFPLQTSIHAFISSRLACCSLLFYGIMEFFMECNIRRLQWIQNSATGPLARTKRSNQIKPILATLHWIPVSFRIDHCLRSSGRTLLMALKFQLATKGDWGDLFLAPPCLEIPSYIFNPWADCSFLQFTKMLYLAFCSHFKVAALTSFKKLAEEHSHSPWKYSYSWAIKHNIYLREAG